MTTLQSLPPLPAHVHFVGIGGIGMSGLARMLHAWGYRVTGSDATASEQVELLQAEGIPVAVGHNAIEEAGDADLVVATAAVRENNPEMVAAQVRGVPVTKRAELLGLLANARTGIAVAGSHGKSTTSGMLVTALRALGRDPNYAVGAIVASTGTNAAPGTDDLMVVEADEYDYSFLWLKPSLGIITNIDYDHPDLFPDQATYDAAFAQFIRGCPNGSVLAVNGDDPGIERVLGALGEHSIELVRYGHGVNADWLIDENTVTTPDGFRVTLELSVPGQHNIGNATGALIVLNQLGFAVEPAARALETFSGVGRRFDLKGEVNGVTVIDDYAHHPTEVQVTIAAARDRYPIRRIVAAFQPHTYTRTKALASEFARALDAADVAVVLDIYAARETESLGASSADILSQMTNGAMVGGQIDDAVVLLADLAKSGDVILTMGAGDITLLGPRLLATLRSAAR